MEELKDYANKFKSIHEEIDRLKESSQNISTFKGIMPHVFYIIDICSIAFVLNVTGFILLLFSIIFLTFNFIPINIFYTWIKLYLLVNLFFILFSVAFATFAAFFKNDESGSSKLFSVIFKSFLPNVLVVFTFSSLYRFFDEFNDFNNFRKNKDKYQKQLSGLEVKHQIDKLLNEEKKLLEKTYLNVNVLTCLSIYKSSDNNDPVFRFKKHVESNLRSNLDIKNVFQYQIENNIYNIKNL